MNNGERIIKVVFCVLLVFSLLPVQSVKADVINDAPAENEEIVWTLKTFYSDSYISVFSPSENKDIYIIENTNNVFYLKQTMVYYWPIDREYKADWGALDEYVPSQMVIEDKDGRVVNILELQPTIIDMSDTSSGMYDLLFSDEEATEYYNEYLSERDHYFDAVDSYDKEYAAYLKSTSEGEKTTAPEMPVVFERVLDKPKQGFIVNLPAGNYTIYAIDESGEMIQTSDRSLKVIKPRRQGVGYSILPYSQWTKPQISYTESEKIYTGSDSKIFLVPYAMIEYNQREIARLQNPQDKSASENNWTWIKLSALTGYKLQVEVNDEYLTDIAFSNYKVDQSAGSSLGYEILEIDSSSDADIAGYYLDVQALPSKAIHVQLKDSDGNLEGGSERQIYMVSETFSVHIFLIAILPILVFEGIHIAQRKRMKKYSG